MCPVQLHAPDGVDSVLTGESIVGGGECHGSDYENQSCTLHRGVPSRWVDVTRLPNSDRRGLPLQTGCNSAGQVPDGRGRAYVRAVPRRAPPLLAPTRAEGHLAPPFQNLLPAELGLRTAGPREALPTVPDVYPSLKGCIVRKAFCPAGVRVRYPPERERDVGDPGGVGESRCTRGKQNPRSRRSDADRHGDASLKTKTAAFSEGCFPERRSGGSDATAGRQSGMLAKQRFRGSSRMLQAKPTRPE